MQHVRLGRTGLKVSRLCLGTAWFGSRSDEETSRAILHAAAEQPLSADMKERLDQVTHQFRMGDASR